MNHVYKYSISIGLSCVVLTWQKNSQMNIADMKKKDYPSNGDMF